MNWYHWLGAALILWALAGTWIVRHEMKDWF